MAAHVKNVCGQKKRVRVSKRRRWIPPPRVGYDEISTLPMAGRSLRKIPDVSRMIFVTDLAYVLEKDHGLLKLMER